uniref:Uncharacterized protein n=1 Tax=Amphimedon queenslandica TaxID=400682 RepID=A0A1X7SXU5_AMPQE
MSSLIALAFVFTSQVTEQTGAILRDAGFELEERGKWDHVGWIVQCGFSFN